MRDGDSYKFYAALRAGKSQLITYLSDLSVEALGQLGLTSMLYNWVLCFSIGGLEALEYFLTAGLTDIVNRLDELFQWAAKVGHTALVSRLLNEPTILEQASLSENLALREAAAHGHTQIVVLLLSKLDVYQSAHADDNGAFNLACANGHADIVELLLAIPTVKALSPTQKNLALYNAALEGKSSLVFEVHYDADKILTPEIEAQRTARRHSNPRASENGYLDIIISLLEFDAVRQSDLSWNTTLGSFLGHTESLNDLNKQYIIHGLKRAFWLALQAAPNFNATQNLSDLEKLAGDYLLANRNWMSSNLYLSPQDLIQSLKPQILSLHYYAHAPFLDSVCSDGARQLIQHFVRPRCLEHFYQDAFEATRKLAMRCLQPWIKYAERKHQKVNELIALDHQSGEGSYRLFVSYLGCKRTLDQNPNDSRTALKRYHR